MQPTHAGYDWWSPQTLRAVKPPDVGVSKWPINEVDHFILRKLTKAGLEPARRPNRGY